MKIKKILFLTLLIFAILLLPNVVNAAETFTVDGIKYTVLTENTVEVSGYEETLTEVTIPKTVTDGDNKSYMVTEIGHNAFINCSSLTSIILPDSVVSIGQSAFYQCNSLENITLPANLKSIGIQAFFNCYSLKSITLPDGITTINMSAFAHCSGLETVIIPSSVTEMGNSVFVSCSSLKSVTLPDGLKSIPSMLFSVCSSLETVIIPSSVTSIGSWAFDRCTSLTNVTIPDSITIIGSGAFSGCTTLKTVTIPSSVKIIDDDVFINCDLSILTIQGYPGSVIKNYADFYNIDFEPTYKVTNKVTNLTSSNESFEDNYKATLRTDAGFILPQNILVKIGNTELSTDKYTYNSTTGEIIIPAKEIVGDITIEAITKEQFKVNFDANGGKFSNNKDILILENWKNESDYFEKMDNVEEPTREGFKFLGYYTEKEEGNSFEHLMSEVGIDKEITFYAQWKEIEKIDFAGNTDKQEFTIGTDKTLTFTLDTDKSYGKVLVDDVELSENNGDYSWTFLEGSFPYIKLSENYMKTLKVGTHTIKFVLDNGNEAEAIFTIVEKVAEEKKEDQKQENITKEEPSKELDETPRMGNSYNKNNKLIFGLIFVIILVFKFLNKKINNR